MLMVIIAAIYVVCDGDDIFNFNMATLTGNVAAGSGENTYNFGRGRINGNFDIEGNDTWNYTDGISLGNTVTGTGALNVPNNAEAIEGNNLDVSPSGLNLPDLTNFRGHLILGGTLTPAILPVESESDIMVNTDQLTVNEDIVTGGDLTLLARKVDLGADLTARDIGGENILITATGSEDGSVPGDISATKTLPVEIRAGSLTLLSDNEIIDSANINVRLGRGDLQVAVGAGQEAPQFGLLDATPTALSDAVTAFFSEVAAGGQVVSVGQDATQANLAGNIFGLEQVASIDLGLFEEDLSLFSTIGNGIALSLAMCEEVEGCAPDVTEVELDELIIQLEGRIEELNKRLLEADSPEARAKIETLLSDYEQQIADFEKYKRELQAFYAADEEDDAELDDDFLDQFGDEAPTVEQRVQSLRDILQTLQSRMEWLESLKADAGARAKLGTATGIDLTIEAIDELIGAIEQEALFIDAQIKLLLEGLEAHLPEPAFQAELADAGRIQHIHYGPALMKPDDQRLTSSAGFH